MKPLFILFFLASTVISNCQSNFTKAILTKSDGSKTECYIKNTTYEGTQQVFEYSLEKGGKTNTIGVNMLSKVQFEDGMILEKHFIHIISMSTAILERREADYETLDNHINDYFMVEKVMDGPYSFYQFIDKYGFSHFFYKASNDSSIQKLEYKEYVDESAKAINKREFRNQLLFLATSAGCRQKLSATIERAEYNLPDMISIFKKLNDCAGQQSTISNRYITLGPIVRVTINGGAAATSLTTNVLNPASYPGFTNDAFSSKISPLLGASVELIPQKRQKNYVASFDFFYHSYSATTDSLHPTTNLTTFGRIKFSAFGFGPTIRFRLTKTPVAPFIEAGAVYRILVKNGDEYYVRDSYLNSETRTPIFTGKSSSLAFLVGTGVDFKRFSVHANYSFALQKSNTYYSTIFLLAKLVLFNKEK